MAYHQRQGRGRFARQWFSPPGEGLYASWFFQPFYPADLAPGWLVRIAVGLQKAIARTLPGKDIRIKWPNDIYAGPRKLAGILIENQIRKEHIVSSIVGIGINVYQTSFPPPLDASATSLQLEGNAPPSLHVLRRRVHEALIRQIDAPSPPYEEFRKLLLKPLDPATEATLREAQSAPPPATPPHQE